MTEKATNTYDQWVYKALIPFLIIIIWELSTIVDKGLADRLSSPLLIFREFIRVIANGELIVNAWYSLSLIISAFALSCFVAIPLGIAMGANRLIHSLFESSIEMIRPVPPLALLPLAIMWFGIGYSEKLFILFIGTFPPIIISTIYGVRKSDPVLLRAAHSMGATSRDILFKVLIPSALPQIFVGMRIAMGFAFTVIVAAELVATRFGLGYLLTIGWRTYSLELIFVSIISIGGLAYLMEMLLRRARRYVINWEKEEREIIQL